MELKKHIKVIIDIDIARTMLGVAGFSTRNMSEEEIFNKVLSLSDCYGMSYEIVENE